MEAELFEKYYKDDSIIKLNSEDQFLALNKKYNVVIKFHFSHEAIFRSSNVEPSRILLNIYKVQNYQDSIPVNYIENEFFLLVNKDLPIYSVLYKIVIDNKSAKLEMVQKPLVGLELLSNDEIQGVVVEYGIN